MPFSYSIRDKHLLITGVTAILCPLSTLLNGAQISSHVGTCKIDAGKSHWVAHPPQSETVTTHTDAGNY